MTQKTCPEANLIEAFLSQGSYFPNDSSLHQVDKKHLAHKGSGTESWVMSIPEPMVGEHPKVMQGCSRSPSLPPQLFTEKHMVKTNLAAVGRMDSLLPVCVCMCTR